MGSIESKIYSAVNGIEKSVNDMDSRYGEISKKAGEIVKRINDKNLNSDTVTCSRITAIAKENLAANYNEEELNEIVYAIGFPTETVDAKIAKELACRKIVSFYQKKVKVLEFVKNDSGVCKTVYEEFLKRIEDMKSETKTLDSVKLKENLDKIKKLGSEAKTVGSDYNKLNKIVDKVTESKNLSELAHYSKMVHDHLGKMNAVCKHEKIIKPLGGKIIVPTGNSSGPTSEPEIKIVAKKYKVLFDFEENFPNTLSVKRGELVSSDGLGRGGYVWVTNGINKSGFVPQSYVGVYNSRLGSA